MKYVNEGALTRNAIDKKLKKKRPMGEEEVSDVDDIKRNSIRLLQVLQYLLYTKNIFTQII